MFTKRLLLLFCAISFTFSSKAQQFETFYYKKAWVDSVYDAMSPRERIGQLFMVAAYSGGEKKNVADIKKLIRNKQIGGLIFMQGTAEAQAELTNIYQNEAQIKLLLAMDAEWGLGMRLTGVRDYPKQMMIAATQNPDLMHKVGVAIAEQCKLMGVHINFAPTIDINNNPKNPVINFRSFGDVKEKVAEYGIIYMNALQDNGIMACAKHFPGHGDVTIDSHLDLPIINKSKAELLQTELYPFQQLIDKGVQSVMIAHLNIPALDNQPEIPSTLSYPIVTGLLKQEMHFDGLIFTDALNMEGVTKYSKPGHLELNALLAGNDVLLFSQNVPKAIDVIDFAIKEGSLTEERLAYSVKKILAAKYNAGLTSWKKLSTVGLTEKLNASTSDIYQTVANQAITVYKDEVKFLKTISDTVKNIVFVNINGTEKNTAIFKANFPASETVTISAKDTNTINIAKWMQKNKNKTIVLSIHNLNRYPGKQDTYGLTSMQISFLQAATKLNKAVYLVHGTPYIIPKFCSARTVIVGYEDYLSVQNAMLRVLLNDYKPTGKLPVTICNKK